MSKSVRAQCCCLFRSSLSPAALSVSVASILLGRIMSRGEIAISCNVQRGELCISVVWERYKLSLPEALRASKPQHASFHLLSCLCLSLSLGFLQKAHMGKRTCSLKGGRLAQTLKQSTTDAWKSRHHRPCHSLSANMKPNPAPSRICHSISRCLLKNVCLLAHASSRPGLLPAEEFAVRPPRCSGTLFSLSLFCFLASEGCLLKMDCAQAAGAESC